ncbi:MAG TPA: kelch repeat-containing protein, partial [Planctomycetota bacterium]|nr:kelch repeat-containing protein [Planctomycetota bacterium]
MRRNHALLAGISLAASSWAQTWLPLPAAGPGPGSWSMVSDSLRSRLVLVGGNGTQTETWTFAGVAWSLATPPASPPARIGHGLSYDIARGVVVLFGGADSTGTMLRNDLWEYDGVAWSQRMPAASPSPRAAVGMVYDAARGMHVLFGGTTVPSAPMVCGVTDETWLWDGANWQQAAPATLPPARAQPAMAYDPARGRVVMVGGSGFGVPHCSVTFWFDTFEWDGVNWNERAIEHPSALQTSGFAAHGPVRGAVLVN